MKEQHSHHLRSREILHGKVVDARAFDKLVYTTGMFSVLREHRLLCYRSNTDRFIQTTKEYANAATKSPVDFVLQGVAGAVHAVTGIVDTAIGDIARAIEGNKSDVPAYSGALARVRDDVRDFVGSIVALKPLSALAKVIRLPGDIVADGADLLAGQNHSRAAYAGT